MSGAGRRAHGGGSARAFGGVPFTLRSQRCRRDSNIRTCLDFRRGFVSAGGRGGGDGGWRRRMGRNRPGRSRSGRRKRMGGAACPREGRLGGCGEGRVATGESAKPPLQWPFRGSRTPWGAPHYPLPRKVGRGERQMTSSHPEQDMSSRDAKISGGRAGVHSNSTEFGRLEAVTALRSSPIVGEEPGEGVMPRKPRPVPPPSHLDSSLLP